MNVALSIALALYVTGLMALIVIGAVAFLRVLRELMGWRK